MNATIKAAYTAVSTEIGYVVAIAEENVRGYKPQPRYGVFPTYDEASREADKLNEDLGLSKIEAIKITLSSMYPERKGDSNGIH